MLLFQLTDSLQNALLGVLTRKFSDRLVIVKSKASVSSLSPRQGTERGPKKSVNVL